MKIREIIPLVFLIVLGFALSYSLCSTYTPKKGYVSRRQAFCANPLFVGGATIVFIIIFMLYRK